MTNYFLAIDIGASSGRHILGCVKNGIILLDEVYRFPNNLVRQGELLCWDYDALFGHILEGMKADSVAQEECDVVVPRACIAEYVKAAKRIALSHGIRVEPYGHCGDGNIHTEMLRGPEMSDEEWKSATHASLTELYALSKKLGGQLSGEHGIGNGRLEFLEEFVGERMIRLYKSIKLAFDDRLILNPGKVIEFNK